VYAFGCLLYELLTGGPPFTAETPTAVLLQHIRETPRPPSTRRPDLPAAWDAIVLRALAKRPEDRYADAAEMRAAVLAADTTPSVQDNAVGVQDSAVTQVGGAPVTRPVSAAEPAPPKTGGRSAGDLLFRSWNPVYLFGLSILGVAAGIYCEFHFGSIYISGYNAKKCLALVFASGLLIAVSAVVSFVAVGGLAFRKRSRAGSETPVRPYVIGLLVVLLLAAGPQFLGLVTAVRYLSDFDGAEGIALYHSMSMWPGRAETFFWLGIVSAASVSPFALMPMARYFSAAARPR
jgi:hypothetical protein